MSSENLADARENVIDEIISTEESYVTFLGKVVTIAIPLFREQVFRKHLGLTEESVSIVFSNIETIHNFHKTLLHELRSRDVVPVFLKYSAFLKLYTAYANNFEKSHDMLAKLARQGKRGWNKFMTQVKKHIDCELESLLIKPIQRIPRYLLLINRVLEYTPDDDPKKRDVEECCKKINEVASFIDNEKDKLKTMNKLREIREKVRVPFDLISPTRMFLREGVLVLLSSKYFKRKKRHRFMLFNDILLWTAKNGKYKGVRKLKHLRTGTTNDPPGCLVLVNEQEHLIKVVCHNDGSRDSWNEAIITARDELESLEASRIMALEERKKFIFASDIADSGDNLRSLVNEYETEDDDDLEHEPMDSMEVNELIDEAFSEQTVANVKTALTELEASEKVAKELSNLHDRFVQIKTILDVPRNRRRRNAVTFDDRNLIEIANDQTSVMADKVMTSIKKFGQFSRTDNPQRRNIRQKSLFRKFGCDARILSETILEIKGIQETEAEEKKSARETVWRKFWGKHFGDTTITDFGDVRKKYEEEFGIKLTDEICDELLFQFAFPQKSPFLQHKLLPISLKDFGIVANVLGFPWDLAKLSRTSRSVSKVSAVKEARERYLKELLFINNADEIKAYFNTGNNWKLLQKRFTNGDTIFHLVARRDDVQVLDVILSECGSRVEMPKVYDLNRNSLLPLHYAAFEGNHNIFKTLVSLTPQEIIDRHPLLHEAVKFNQLDCVKRLMENRNTDPAFLSPEGDSILTIASASGSLDMVQLLLLYGIIPTEQDLLAAVDSDNPEVVKLLAKTVKTEQKDFFARTSSPLLNIAAFIGTVDVCNALLESGASLRHTDEKSKETAFLAAAKGGNLAVSRFFVSKDENVVHDRDVFLKTALLYSAEGGDVEMARSLIVLGVDVNAQDENGNTALILCSKRGESEMLSAILTSPEIDVNIKNNKNESALNCAVTNIDKDACTLLVASGADVESFEEKLGEIIPEVMHPPPQPLAEILHPRIPTEELSAQPKEPSDQPTLITSQPEESVESSNEPVESSNEPVESSSEPVEQFNQPEEPSNQPEVPPDQPEVPSDQPEVPSDQPDVPSDQPEVPSDQPEVQSDQPEVPSDQPDEPPNQLDELLNQPDERPNQPDERLNQPDEPLNQPDEPLNQPDEPPNEPDEPPNQPDEPPNQPHEQRNQPEPSNQSEKPFNPPNQLEEPSNQPEEPSDQPVHITSQPKERQGQQEQTLTEEYIPLDVTPPSPEAPSAVEESIRSAEEAKENVLQKLSEEKLDASEPHAKIKSETREDDSTQSEWYEQINNLPSESGIEEKQELGSHPLADEMRQNKNTKDEVKSQPKNLKITIYEALRESLDTASPPISPSESIPGLETLSDVDNEQELPPLEDYEGGLTGPIGDDKAVVSPDGNRRTQSLNVYIPKDSLDPDSVQRAMSIDITSETTTRPDPTIAVLTPLNEEGKALDPDISAVNDMSIQFDKRKLKKLMQQPNWESHMLDIVFSLRDQVSNIDASRETGEVKFFIGTGKDYRSENNPPETVPKLNISRSKSPRRRSTWLLLSGAKVLKENKNKVCAVCGKPPHKRDLKIASHSSGQIFHQSCLKANWHPDEAFESCERCHLPFHWLYRWRHHCRRCGHVICVDCSTKTNIPIWRGRVRVCKRNCPGPLKLRPKFSKSNSTI